MSADPFIQAQGSLQSHNRYAYVMNNPLNLTDPSGYFSWKKVFRVVAAIAVGYFTGAWIAQSFNLGAFAAGGATAFSTGGFQLTALGAALAGAGGGFAAGLISSGTLKGGLQGALTGGVFGGIGGLAQAGEWGSAARIAGHAAGGCITAVAGGGACGAGAASAAFGKFTTIHIDGAISGDIAKGIATVVAGGVGSVIAGGKFENGAVTAAYGYLFNHCSQGGCTTKLEQALYDYWPGYKAGTLLYNQTMGDGSWTGWEVVDAVSLGAGAAGKGLQALQGLRAGAVGLEFGANTNQVSHAFRHADDLGLARDAVAAAIRTDMSAAILQVGQGVTRSVTVNGIDLTYRAHRLNDARINIGRITGPRP